MAVVQGGDKVGRALSRIAAKLGTNKTLKVGFLDVGAVYPSGISVADVAAIQEFGAPAAGIPPRPFFRTMVKDKSPDWPRALNRALKRYDYDLDAALNFVGGIIAEQLRQSIIDTNEPALSEVTLLLREWRAAGMTIGRKQVWKAIDLVRRGESAASSAKPLIETGTMLAAVGYKVEEE